MRNISLSLATALLVLAGCASQNDGLVAVQAPTVVASNNTDVTAKTKVVCHKETTMGSNMIHSVCETEQSESDRQALQNKMLDNAAQNTVNHQGIGH